MRESNEWNLARAEWEGECSTKPAYSVQRNFPGANKGITDGTVPWRHYILKQCTCYRVIPYNIKKLNINVTSCNLRGAIYRIDLFTVSNSDAIRISRQNI